MAEVESKARSREFTQIWHRYGVALAAFGLVLLGLIAYHNSLSGPFILDDVRWIAQGNKIRQPLWPLGPFFDGTVRPLLFYTLAINYRIGGLHVDGYHAFNVAVHIAAALVLFGLIRQTLRLPRFENGLESASLKLAFASAAIWLVHPLQTQAVNYLIQRCETMMALFFLLALYAILRGAGAAKAWPWNLLAIVSATLGMGSKPVMIAFLPVALLFDRVFLASTWQGVFKKRWYVYLGILPAIAWLLLKTGPGIEYQFKAAGTVVASAIESGDLEPGNAFAVRPVVAEARPRQAGELVTPMEYARTQPAVILHYLRLVVWPNPLCFDYYAWPISSPSESGPPMLLIVALVAASALALRFAPPVGFLGMAFFLVLAPTSSIMPIQDLAFEHRMYLPSAAMITLLVVLGYCGLQHLLRRTSWSADTARIVTALVFSVAVFALLAGTIARNYDYASRISLWESVLRVRPANVRALNHLASAHLDSGNDEQARAVIERAAQLAPDNPWTQGAAAELLFRQGRYDQAAQLFEQAVTRAPTDPILHLNLGAALEKLDQSEAAVRHFKEAIRLRPDVVQAHNGLGHALVQSGQLDAGIDAYKQALSLEPRYYDAVLNLGVALAQKGQFDEAVQHLRNAVRIEPRRIIGYENLALTYANAGNYAEAIRAASKAAALAEQGEDQRLAAELNERIREYEVRLKQGRGG